VGVMGALIRGLAVLAIAILALVLGFLGLHTFLVHHAGNTFGTSWADTSYYDLQLFLLASAPLNGPGPFPVPLEIARVLAPVTTVLAGLEALRLLLGEQIRRWTAAYAPNHAIVTGDGPIAIELARRLRKGSFRTVVLAGARPETVDQIRELQLLDIAGDPSDLNTLRAAGIARASIVYACADHSATNAATALRAREFTKDTGHELLVYALVRDAEISTALRARRIGVRSDRRFRLEFFSIEGLAARALLDRYPACDRTVIVGFGRLGQAVLHEIARRHDPSRRALVTVTDLDGRPDQIAAFLKDYPAVARNCEVTITSVIPEPQSDISTTIVVCLPENEQGLRVGLDALRRPASASDIIVICMSERSPFADTFNKDLLDDVHGRLRIFDVLEEACVPDRIKADVIDQLARAIHRAYLDECVARGESPQVNRSMRPWEELSDDLKHANAEQAMHIGDKLEAINCVLVPESDLVPDFAFTDKEMEQLAEMEHERWMRERAGYGYSYGPERDGTHHPDMAEWAVLSEGAKNKDRDVIRHLPDILRQAGFQILRLPPAT
jgi:hypothetical protein